MLHSSPAVSPTQSNVLSTQPLLLLLTPPPQEAEHGPQFPHSSSLF